jgi:hypothetical protein
MSTRAKLFMFWCILTLLCTSVLSGQQCDAALIEAMRTNYKMTSGDTIHRMVQQQACNEKQRLAAIPLAG